MVATRSQSSNKAKSETTDGKEPSNSQSEKSRTTAKAEASKSPPKTSSPRKRKGRQQPSTSPTKKHTPTVKTEQHQELDTSGQITPPPPTTVKATAATSQTILINRAPVLHLWSACVAQFLYTGISWPTSLAIGSAIATLCAISKGRSIGKIDPADHPDKQAEKARKSRQTAESADDRELNVMGFPIHVQNERVMVQGKPKTANEDALKAKFGGEKDYDIVKGAMERALMGWKGKEGELDKSAFGMYEKFRPVVQPGQRGWGRKGELRVEDINEVVRRE